MTLAHVLALFGPTALLLLIVGLERYARTASSARQLSSRVSDSGSVVDGSYNHIFSSGVIDIDSGSSGAAGSDCGSSDSSDCGGGGDAA